MSDEQRARAADANVDANADANTGVAQTYEAATARIEEIIRRLDSGDASLDETLELIKEGKALIERCASELSAVGDALTELRLDELVDRLSDEAGGGGG